MSSIYPKTMFPPKQKRERKQRNPNRKYLDPKALVMKDGKCYTMEELYGKEDEQQNKNK